MRTALLLANTGTAMIWAMGLHLLFGNALIGILEGLIIARLFKRRWWVSCLIMILANYVSMFAGTYLLTPFAETLAAHWAADGSILFHLRSLQFAMLAFAFVVTLLIEWPFCLWIVRKLPHAGRKAWKANVVAQIISYALLVWWYGGASRTSIVSKTTLHRDVAFARPPIAAVYYVNPDDGDIWRIQTDGTGRERALEADIAPGRAPLAFALAGDGRSWDLYLRDRPMPNSGGGVRIAESLATGRACDDSFSSDEGRVFRGDMTVPDLRAQTDPAWTLWYNPYGGFGVRPRDHFEDFPCLAFGLPGLTRRVLSPTILSSGQVIFELDGTIMLLAPKTRDLGVLTRGRGPAVIEPGETFNTWVDPMTPKRSPTTKPASSDETGISSRPMTAFPTTAPAEGEPAAGE